MLRVSYMQNTSEVHQTARECVITFYSIKFKHATLRRKSIRISNRLSENDSDQNVVIHQLLVPKNTDNSYYFVFLSQAIANHMITLVCHSPPIVYDHKDTVQPQIT